MFCEVRMQSTGTENTAKSLFSDSFSQIFLCNYVGIIYLLVCIIGGKSLQLQIKGKQPCRRTTLLNRSRSCLTLQACCVSALMMSDPHSLSGFSFSMLPFDLFSAA